MSIYQFEVYAIRHPGQQHGHTTKQPVKTRHHHSGTTHQSLMHQVNPKQIIFSTFPYFSQSLRNKDAPSSNSEDFCSLFSIPCSSDSTLFWLFDRVLVHQRRKGEPVLHLLSHSFTPHTLRSSGPLHSGQARLFCLFQHGGVIEFQFRGVVRLAACYLCALMRRRLYLVHIAKGPAECLADSLHAKFSHQPFKRNGRNLNVIQDGTEVATSTTMWQPRIVQGPEP